MTVPARGGLPRLVAAVAALLFLSCGRPNATRRDLVALFPLAMIGAEPTVLDFGAPETRRYLVEGWSSDETGPDGVTFVWGIGTRSVVEFYLRETRDLPLVFRCQPFVPGALPQTVSFELNGAAGPSVTLHPGIGDYHVELPAATTRAGWNRLALKYGHARAPRDVTGSDDGRPLAVAWDFIRFGNDGAGKRELPRIDRERRKLFVPDGGVVSYALRLPERAALGFEGIAFSGDPGATLTVRLDADGKRAVVAGQLDRTSRGGSLALPAGWAGIVRLSLEARGGGVSLVDPALVLPPAAAPPAPRPGAVPRPNIIVYLVDTLRADRLGCYGHDDRTSPSVDALARDGVLFDDAIADSGWTRPSVASLFTGLPARVHGANGRGDGLSPEATTIAQLLHESGYETAGFITNGNVAHLYGFDRGFEVFELVPGTIVPAVDGSVPAEAAGRGAPRSAAVNTRALEWLDRREHSRPFFLYLHTADPHSPYEPAPEFRARVGAPGGPPELGSLSMMGALKQGKRTVDAALVKDLLGLYTATVAENDQRFGELLAELRRRGLYDDALVVFVSDHGEEFAEHGGWEHGRTLYREVTRIPLVVKLPVADGLRGLRIARTVQLTDVLPTLFDYLRLARPRSLSGTSLLAGIGVADRTRPGTAVSHLDLDGALLDTVIEGRWKLIRDREQIELYDRSSDPLERANLALDRPITGAYLEARLAENAAFGSVALRARPASMTEDVRANLRALGYVQ